MLVDFARHLLMAGNEHAIHSPFVFEFYQEIVKAKRQSSDFEDIDTLAASLKTDNRYIEVLDYGAGSRFGNGKSKQVSQLARTAIKNRRWGDIVAAIVKKYKHKRVVELGTSLGITTARLARATPQGQVLSFEGCPETLKIAQENLEKLKINNVQLVQGNIDETLDAMLQSIDRLDFVFFDANHQYEPTLRYFRKCLQKAHEESCFVFDDIYWSAGMKKAWHEIIASEAVGLSLDFFQIGIVFFRKKQPKQHFVLRA